jgi:hypothetical protein
MLCRVALLSTDVSEDHIASITKVVCTVERLSLMVIANVGASSPILVTQMMGALR